MAGKGGSMAGEGGSMAGEGGNTALAIKVSSWTSGSCQPVGLLSSLRPGCHAVWYRTCQPYRVSFFDLKSFLNCD